MENFEHCLNRLFITDFGSLLQCKEPDGYVEQAAVNLLIYNRNFRISIIHCDVKKNAPNDVSVKQTRKLIYETFRISVHFGLEVQEFDGFKGYSMMCFS